MNIEELLKPRYKVIADYPGSPFRIDSILHQHPGDDGLWVLHLNMNRMPPAQRDLQLYPHLFKPLQWWEERKLEDMPEYVKFTIDYWQYKEGDIVPVFNWYDYPNACIYHNNVTPFTFEPATEAEYLDYLTQQNKKA